MKLKDIEVSSGTTGVKKRGQVLACDCGSEAFIVFQIAGQDHAHYQCTMCGMSACPEGADFACIGKEATQ